MELVEDVGEKDLKRDLFNKRREQFGNPGRVFRMKSSKKLSQFWAYICQERKGILVISTSGETPLIMVKSQ
jgi:hypothetical protein